MVTKVTWSHLVQVLNHVGDLALFNIIPDGSIQPCPHSFSSHSRWTLDVTSTRRHNIECHQRWPLEATDLG